MTVLLVDEIDMLMTRDQSVLYNVFSWPHFPGARLAVIGIANTLDLPQRLLPKIARCCPTPTFVSHRTETSIPFSVATRA